MTDAYAAIVQEALRVPQQPQQRFADHTVVEFEGRSYWTMYAGHNPRYSYNVYHLVPLEGVGVIEMSEPEITTRCKVCST